MLMPHVEHDVTARPVAHLFGKILARTCWALTLARLPFVLRSGRLLTPPLPILPILLTPLLATGLAGPVTTARFDATPTLGRSTTLRIAITSLGTCRREPLFTALQQTTTVPARETTLPRPREMMKY